MKINGNEIRPGNVIQHNGELWVAVKLQHVKPGKGGAFAQIELKNLINGSKLNERFRSADKVERVRLEQTDYQFLYESDDMLVFMDTESYEQIELQAEFVGDRAAFLQDGMNVIINIYNDEPVSVVMPDSCIEEIIEADAVIKGQTVSSSFKPAILKNGVKVMVPGHIEVGTKIVVRPSDCSYIEKAKI